MDQEHNDAHARLFRELTPVRTPENLYSSVLASVDTTMRRNARMQFIYSTALGISSVALLFPAMLYTKAELAQSGFFEYLSLAFSDGGAVFTYWQMFAVTMLESLPVLGITLVLTALFGLMNAVRLAGTNTMSNYQLV